MNRLEQIAEKLGVSVQDILKFGDTISNFFDQCNSVIAGLNNGGQSVNDYDSREFQHKLEKSKLENEKLKAEKEKAELEVKYWREKCERV